MYITKVYFEDAQDEHRPYKPGDVYPRDGLNPSKQRIKELSSDKNIRGIPLIAYVEPQKEEPKMEEPRPVRKQRKRKNADDSL